MKFCKDCKYYMTLPPDCCKHPNNGFSPVTGEVKVSPASFLRSAMYRCGEEGNWFEEISKPYMPPKETPPVVTWVKTLFSRSN